MTNNIEMIEKWKYDLSHIIREKDREKNQTTKDLALEKAVRAICLGEKDNFFKKAIRVICLGKKNNFETCLLEIIEILGGQEAISFLKTNKELAYYIYCLGK